jgi:hypothetical protein
MTGTELDILVKLIDNNHAESMRRFDRIEERVDRIEEAPRLTVKQVRRLERTADRVEAATQWLSPKRIAVIASVPGSGGAVYLFNWLHNVLR